MKRIVLALALVATTVRTDSGVTPVLTELNYTGPSGVRWTITADGLSAIHLGERPIASGNWQLARGHLHFAIEGDDPGEGPVIRKEIEILSTNSARVTHLHGSPAPAPAAGAAVTAPPDPQAPVVVRAVYTYTFRGEDLEIKAWVENHHPRAALEMVHFTGLRVEFGRVPEGRMPVWHASYTHANPDSAIHPGNLRIGASWAYNKEFGIGLSPGDAFRMPTIAMWDWNWQPGIREKDTGRQVRYYAQGAVPPGGARTFTITWRCSTNTDWKHLVAPYQAIYRAYAGEQPAYNRADNRPIIQSVVNSAVGQISPANPYGLHSGRRVDTADGVVEFGNKMAAGLGLVNGQGVILWGQGGSDPRGGMYRPDFDVVPPEIDANLVKLAAQLGAGRGKLGLTTRPAQVAERDNWSSDVVAWMAPSRDNLEILGRRFERAKRWAPRLYYLDSFGNRIDDIAIMRRIRAVIGPDVQTYAEHGSDVILPLSGLYTEMGWDKERREYVFAFLDLETLEFFRWLEPELPICARIDFGNPWEPPAPGVEPPAEYLLKHRFTPMFGDYFVQHHPEQAKQFGELTRKHLDDAGQWKISAP